MEKVLYIVKTKLHYYPPCISQIRMLNDLGYDIEVLYGTSDNSALQLLSSEGINCKKIADIEDENPGIRKKAASWYLYRRGLLNELKKYDKRTLLWFGTAESALPLKGALSGRRYILSLLELLDDSPEKVNLLKSIARNALAITVCEETRGYIMRYWWHLNNLPYVFPNKPYKQIRERCYPPSTNETAKVIKKIGSDRIILYQGIIQNTEELLEIAKALKVMQENYTLLLMGIDKYNSVERIKSIYDKVIYVPYIPAPYHLEITSYAHIGITFYRNDSLNKAFCAPNKIYEYSGFGIPILANDVPGLKNTVGAFGAAECIELKEPFIIEALKKIEAEYDSYSVNARDFFEATDNLKTIKRLMEDISS